jgi:hypothetical protein
MNYMKEAVEYLRNYENLITSIANLRDEILGLKVDLKSVKELSYSDMPHGSRDAALADDVIVNKMFQLKKAEEDYKETSRTLKRMDKTMERFKDSNEVYYNILSGYFIDQYTEEQLMKDFNYSDRHLRRIKQNALRAFAIQLFGISAMK